MLDLKALTKCKMNLKNKLKVANDRFLIESLKVEIKRVDRLISRTLRRG